MLIICLQLHIISQQYNLLAYVQLQWYTRPYKPHHAYHNHINKLLKTTYHANHAQLLDIYQMSHRLTKFITNTKAH